MLRWYDAVVVVGVFTAALIFADQINAVFLW